MSKHTPGPWVTKKTPSCWIIMPAQAKIVPHVKSEADAARIVSCVNALEGVENPEAMAEVFKGLVEALKIAEEELFYFSCVDENGVTKGSRQQPESTVDHQIKSAIAKASKILRDEK